MAILARISATISRDILVNVNVFDHPFRWKPNANNVTQRHIGNPENIYILTIQVKEYISLKLNFAKAQEKNPSQVK